MISIHNYRDKIITIKQSGHSGNESRPSKIMAAIAVLLQQAEPILFKDGKFKKPNIIQAFKLGWIAFTFIKALFTNE